MGGYLFFTDSSGDVRTTADRGSAASVEVSEGSAAPGSPVTACVTSYRIPRAEESLATITLLVADPAGGIFATSAPDWHPTPTIPHP
jgi:hypothetical protein